MPGHEGSVIAVAFREDGKFLASYSPQDSSIRIWRIDTGIFRSLLGKRAAEKQVQFVPEIESGDFSDIELSWDTSNKVVLVRENGEMIQMEVLD